MKALRDLFNAIILGTIFIFILVYKIYTYVYWRKKEL